MDKNEEIQGLSEDASRLEEKKKRKAKSNWSYYRINREKILAKKRRLYAENPEKYKVAVRKYKATLPARRLQDPKKYSIMRQISDGRTGRNRKRTTQFFILLEAVRQINQLSDSIFEKSESPEKSPQKPE